MISHLGIQTYQISKYFTTHSGSLYLGNGGQVKSGSCRGWSKHQQRYADNESGNIFHNFPFNSCV